MGISDASLVHCLSISFLKDLTTSSLNKLRNKSFFKLFPIFVVKYAKIHCFQPPTLNLEKSQTEYLEYLKFIFSRQKFRLFLWKRLPWNDVMCGLCRVFFEKLVQIKRKRIGKGHNRNGSNRKPSVHDFRFFIRMRFTPSSYF